MNETDPAVPWPPAAVTRTGYVPGLSGQPVTSPPALTEIPAGRPLAENDGGWPGTGTARASRQLTGLPATPCCFPGSSKPITAGLSWSRSVCPASSIPATVPTLVYCQIAQLPQPAGLDGLDPLV